MSIKFKDIIIEIKNDFVNKIKNSIHYSSLPTFKDILRFIGLVILSIAFFVSIFMLVSYTVMLLWNWLMPDIFNLPVITFWQSVGLVFLLTIIRGWIVNPTKSNN